MKKIITLSGAFLTLSLTGCATTDDSGRNTVFGSLSEIGSTMGRNISGAVSSLDHVSGQFVTPEQLKTLLNGATQEETIALIGQPDTKTELKGNELWSYTYVKIPTFGANISEKTTVEFHKGISVKAYKSGLAKGESTGNPLLDAANAQ